MNKKGADPIVWIIIALGLALLVFVILAYVFGINVFDVFRKIVPNKVNVDDIARTCATACQTQSYIQFCCVQRDVILRDGEKAVKMACKDDSKLRGDCSVDCSAVVCPRNDSEFKVYCKENCVNDNAVKEKAFCCRDERDAKSCVSAYSDITKRAESLGITAVGADSSCNLVDCKDAQTKDIAC